MADAAGKILILGAAGRLGSAAADAFRDAGWAATSHVRPGAAERAPKGTKVLETVERAVVVEAARGADVVLHALNAPFTEWQRVALPMVYSAIEAAEVSGATLMFPGNMYNYGEGMPPVIDETTPMQPTSRKGRLRVETERLIHEATERGMRAVVLRAGDFFGAGRGAWFDLVIARELREGRVNFPGPPDAMHAWAYTPDFAAALVKLAAVRASLPPFASFGFPGHGVTHREFVTAIGDAVPQEIFVKPVNWWLIRTVGRLTAMGRELAEIGYLWNVPHRINGSKLKAAIGDIPHTPLDEAMKAALRELGVIE